MVQWTSRISGEIEGEEKFTDGKDLLVKKTAISTLAPIKTKTHRYISHNGASLAFISLFARLTLDLMIKIMATVLFLVLG